MPNNKGFAISSVLYLLLVAFLMFLMITLAQFTSSTSVIGKANDDLINGTTFKAVQVKSVIENSSCGTDYEWYQSFDSELGTYKDSNTIVKITSKHGTIYWPKDFPNARITDENNNINPVAGDQNGNIKVEFDNSSINTDNGIYGELTFTDTKGTTEDEDDKKITIFLADVCK